MNISVRLACTGALIVAAGGPIALVAQTPIAASGRTMESLRLGTVDFPTSGGAAAQSHFVHGVAALHSFWYEEALEAFARATEIDPQFAMAYWGEAMCYYRTFRPGTDLAAGRRALGKIKATWAVTARERGYIEALHSLYGQTGNANQAAYATAMEKLRLAHPEDREAAAFHALALLARGTLENRNKAGEIAREVYRQNPNHPGAAHYIIHSYDDPQRADRALEAAQHYAKIAPDAPHALHMPSHIFLQLGMWDEAFNSNDLGWTASVDYVKRKALAPTMRDYHNLHWQIYALLQQGRHARAGELVEEFVRMRAQGELAPVSARYIDTALANYVTDTRRWDRADALFSAASPPAAPGSRGGEVELCGVAPAATPQSPKKQAPNPLADTGTFLRAYAAAARGVAAAGDRTIPGLRD
ncbi:MAG: tetratricopeptide repeat protein, partial [Opitutaceae bacterium]